MVKPRQKTLTALLFFCALSSAHAATHRKNFIVILDAGHGGEDTGAVQTLGSAQVAEKDLTLAIARETARVLKSQNIPVVLTREGDKSVGLERRSSIANRAAGLAKDAVFVSIHANSSHEHHSSGVETYVFNATTNEASKRLADIENGSSNSTLDLILADLTTTGNFEDSMKLACSIQSSVVTGLNASRYPARNRGVRQALFYVLMKTRIPSVLFELGFLSNPTELAALKHPQHQTLLAKQLARGILNWRKKTAHCESQHAAR